MNDYKIKIACHAIHTKEGKPYLLVPDGKGAAEAISAGYDCRALVYETDACARIQELENLLEAFLDNERQMIKRQEEMQAQIDWLSIRKEILMGTRSTTRVYNNGHMLLALYCQYDGYPECVGSELANFIISKPFVNGLNFDDQDAFNGMGCFAARLLAKLKTGAGLWYVTGKEEQREEWNYEIHGGLDENLKPMPIRFVCKGWGHEFDGLPEGFSQWLEHFHDA